MKRVGVVGTLVWDRIWPSETSASGGEPLEGWGGIAYSLAALAAVMPAEWEIVPLVKVGSDLAAEADTLLRAIPGLSLEPGVRSVSHPNNRVELRYRDAANRTEQLTGGVPPWRWDELAPLVGGLDAVYINFITGFELELPEMERLRDGYTGPIYSDVHSLLLARAADGRRSPRSLPNRERWLRCFDAVQINEQELRTLADNSPDPWHFAAASLEAGPSLFLVTLGTRGASYLAAAGFPPAPARWRAFRANRSAEPPIGPATIPMATAEIRSDPTGCGDVWGATVFGTLLGGRPLEEAIRLAHRAAARNAAFRGASGLYTHLLRKSPAG